MSPFFDRVRLQWRGRARPLLVQDGPDPEGGPSICPGATLYNSGQLLSRWLRAEGVQSGESLGFRCPTALDWIAVALAGAKLGLRLTLEAEAHWHLDEEGGLQRLSAGPRGVGAPGWIFPSGFVPETDLIARLDVEPGKQVVESVMDWHSEEGVLQEALPALWYAEEIHVPCWSQRPAFVPTRTAAR